MTFSCIMCKKRVVSGDTTRSFHKFPDDKELRQKWMYVIGISSIKKCSRVCSDHFDNSSFHDTDGYTRIRRLVSNAVPRRIISSPKALSNVTNTRLNSVDCKTAVLQNIDCKKVPEVKVTETVDYNQDTNMDARFETTDCHQVQCNNSEIESSQCDLRHMSSLGIESHVNSDITTENSSSDWSDLSNTSQASADSNVSSDLNAKDSSCDSKNINSPGISQSTTDSCDTGNSKLNTDSHNSRKRKGAPIEVDHIPPTKKFCYMDGSQPKYVSRDDFKTDEAWRRFLGLMIYTRRNNRNARDRARRGAKSIGNLKQLVACLREEEASSAADYLEGLPEHVKELLTRMKDKKSTAPFPSHLKTFAQTLHFHSPAAYEMVRRSFLKCLPCIETLNKWISSKDYKPGINDEIIDHVSEMVKNESMKKKKLVFNLTFDEMGIKKWTRYCKNSQEWKGLIDLGNQLEVNEEKKKDAASKALVFMLVNINGSFKTPVAYYLTNSLTGDQKAKLLKDLMIKLHEKNIDVVSNTFDGDESNQKACKILGANFDYNDKENFKPFYPHPKTSKPVYLFFDPCHMLKLVRNYFALKGPIIYDGDKYINWDYIKKLNNKMYDEGLHLACKIKNRHVYFHNEKMKVFLAAQVLSRSAAKALHYMEYERNDCNFKGASATSEFCQVFNDMFDILNAKNKFCKVSGRKGIMKNDLPELKKKVEEYVQYIEKLEVNVSVTVKSKKEDNKENANKNSNESSQKKETMLVRKPVTQCRAVNTGFVGFIICLKNYYALCETLIEAKIVDYVLSYKLSQDHLEMFFALIRRMNGFSNNPTVVQFTSAFKKLLSNNLNVTVPANANCKPQDETLLVSDVRIESCETSSNSTASNEVKKKKKKRVRVPRLPEFMSKEDIWHSSFNTVEHDYTKHDAWVTTEYADDVVKHTAGAVLHSIKNKIHCKKCLTMLNGEVSTMSKLSILKNRGGLKYASDDVNFICHTAEKVLRRNKESLLSQNIFSKIVTQTVQILPPSVLDYNEHIFDQEPLYDHRQQVIYLIIQSYVNMRLKYESDKLNDIKFRIRTYYNKMTIFKGQ